MEPGGALCHCGMRGCLEAYAGSYGIVRIAKELLGRKRSLLRRLCPDLDGLEPRTVSLAAEKGDPVAQAVWREVGRYLGIGIANLVYVLNPDAVLILGGVSRAGDLILKPVVEFLRGRPFKTPFKHVDVRIGRTPNLGAAGAGLLGIDAA